MGGGGVSSGQRNAAVSGLADTSGTANKTMAGQIPQMQADQTQATNFFGGQMNNGLPFYRNLTDYGSGTVAQAFAPQRAAFLRSASTSPYMPSGYRDAVLNDLGASQARAFDSTLTQAMMANQLAKQQGAQGVQGEQQIAGNEALGFGSLGTGANSTILGGPGRPSVGGVLGGIGNAALQAGATYYGGKRG
jgi:hypothetical protein